MKDLTREDEKAILIKDGCTPIEAIRYLEAGTMIYYDSEKEVFIDIMILSDIMGVIEACEEWESLPKVEFEGEIFRIDYAY